MKLLRTLRFIALGAALAASAATAPAQPAQGFPSKPIRIVVPFGAGTTTDQAARFIGKHLTDMTSQPVIVDNRPGANGFLALQYVLGQPADGYTIVIGTNTTHAANASLFKKLPYDPVADFMPISGIIIGGVVLAVSPSTPANNVKELVALAKQKPGKLSFGSGSSSSRVAGEAFKQMTGVDLLHVPYKSNPLALTDLLGGQITVMWTDMTTGAPMVTGNKLRALAVTSLKRSPQLPNIPTVDEAGVKGYESSFWSAAYMPAGTPPAVVKRMSDLLIKATTTAPAVTALAASTGAEPATMGPEGLGKFQQEESGKWGRIIKAAGIVPE